MPNYVTSRCVVSGPLDEVERFKSIAICAASQQHSDAGGQVFDFNAIIPMPACLQGAEASSIAEIGLALVVYRASSDAPFADHAELWSKWVREDVGMPNGPIGEVAKAYLSKHPEYEEKGRKRLQSILETGFADWYSWSVANWGTKWNSFRFEEISGGLVTDFSFKFETAWSFPTPIFNRLSKMFPDLTFNCSCFDEGWNFAGFGQFGAVVMTPFEIGKATDALHVLVYGHPPERDVEDESLAVAQKDSQS